MLKAALGTLALAVIAMLLWFGYIYLCMVTPDHYSHMGPYRDMHQKTMAFSPDGSLFAYIWDESEYFRPGELGARPRTLSQRLSLKIRYLIQKQPEITIPLDSVDLKPDGIVYFAMDASLQISPDSQHVAAMAARRLLIINASTQKQYQLEYDGEHFGGFAWTGKDDMIFSTVDGKTLTFWRYNINTPAEKRMLIFQTPWTLEKPIGQIGFDSLRLNTHDWSPKGRYVTFNDHTTNPDNGDVLLDTQTGKIQKIPISLYNPCWKHDESAMLAIDCHAKPSVILIDPGNGNILDLTETFEATFGKEMELTLVSSQWMRGDQYIVLYQTIEEPPKDDYSAWKRELKGFVLQPHPLQIVLKQNAILRQTPLADWVLKQGDGNMEWINIKTKKNAPIKGWPNDWIWSDNGKQAAKVENGKIVIFHPLLPPIKK